MQSQLSAILFASLFVIPAVAQSPYQRVQQYASPTIDRWMYPFGGTPGQEVSASIFRTPLDATFNGPAFDDRDAEFVLAFNTAPAIQALRGVNSYRLNSIRVAVTTSNPPRFEYDPTFDSITTTYATTDPEYTADADAGKPVELFAAGYRNGFRATTITETMPFAFASPWLEGVRNIFPASLNANGTSGADLSNQVRDRIEAQPLAIGQVAGLTPGTLVPQGSVMTFEIDLTQPGARAYFQRGLDAGRIVVVVSSLHLTTGGPGGGGGDPNYPAFYTKENPLNVSIPVAATLTVDLALSPNIDFNNDDSVYDPQDVDAFLSVFSEGPCIPETAGCGDIDFNNDGSLFDPQDIDDFLSVFSEGPCSTGNC
jgi:hypothetical protein